MMLLLIHAYTCVLIADVDECADNTDSCVAMISQCLNTIGSYECTCDLGYMDMEDGGITTTRYRPGC